MKNGYADDMNRPITPHDVLTLAEAARFLRLKPAKVRALADSGQIPGRKFDGEWRFLRSALEDSLRGVGDPTAALLQQAGMWKDDETLPELLRDIYKARGRPKDGEFSR